MKKIVFALMATVLACLCLSGCGRREENNSVIVSPDVTPVVTPMPSASLVPEMEDGVVKDTDGIIEDKDSGSSAGTNSENHVVVPTTSPVPSSSPMPSASPNP